MWRRLHHADDGLFGVSMAGFCFLGPQLDECVGAGQRYMPGLGMIYTKPMALKSI